MDCISNDLETLNSNIYNKIKNKKREKRLKIAIKLFIH